MIVACSDGVASESGVKVSSMPAYSWACWLATPHHLVRGLLEAREQPGPLRPRIEQVRHHRQQAVDQRLDLAQGLVEVRAPAGEPVTEAVEVDL